MGCFGSRDSQRQAQFGEDLTLVGYGFRKAMLDNLDKFLPIDALAAQHIGTGKDLHDADFGKFEDGKFATQEAVDKIRDKCFELVKRVYDNAKKEDSTKEDAVGKKWAAKTVVEQLNEVLTALATTGENLKWPEEEEKKEETKEGEEKKEGEEEKKDEAAEGGETMHEGGDAKLFQDALVECFTKHEVFADLLKAATLSVELDSFDPLDFGKMGKMAVSLIPLFPKPEEWAGTCAVLNVMVNAKEAENDKEIWGKAKISADDEAELKEAIEAKDKCALIFPGLSVWNADESKCAATKGPEANNEWTFCIKNSSSMPMDDDKFVICRFIGKIEEADLEARKVTLSDDKEHTYDNVGAWKEAVEKLAGAAGEAKPDAATEEKKDGEEEKKDDAGEEKKDGE